MTRRHALLPVLAALLAGVAAPGRAAPATPEEAGRLAAVLQTYTGAPAPGAPPAVTVTPDGESYRASIDLTRVAAPLHAFDVDLVATEPLVLALTPLPDGTWRVKRGSFPAFGLTTRKGFTYSVRFDGTASEGVFDPRIAAFRHQEEAFGSTSGTITDGSATQRSELLRHGKQVGDARGPGPGDVSTTLHGEETGLAYRSRREAAARAGEAPADLDVAAAVRTMTTDVAMAHQNVAALNALWAFVVAHPSRAQLVAEQPRLRELALALLPYAASLDARSALGGLTFDVNGGRASLDALSQRIALGADDAKDAVALSVKLSGLRVSAKDQLPEWVGALLPENLSLDLQTTPLDVTAALRELVGRTDLGASDVLPADALAAAAAKLARGGAVGVTLKPSAISNGALAIAATGNYDGAASTATLRIEAAGLDKAIALIGRDDDPLAAQVAQALSVAQTLGRRLPDGRLAWDIRASPSAVTVNGLPLR